MPVIKLSGLPIAYRVRSSKRAKRISVRYSLSDGLELVYPPGPQKPCPEALLQERSDWILSTIEKFIDADANRPRRDYREGEEFLFRGAGYKLLMQKSQSRTRIDVRLSGDCLALSLPDPTQIMGSDVIRQAIERFYRSQAQRYLPERVCELAETHGFKYGKVRIKNQKTRWGSCSAKGNINLNLRLMMAPDKAIDYVIMHELCHLRELNHSARFWALVESCCPEYRHWKAWFKQHGSGLIL